MQSNNLPEFYENLDQSIRDMILSVQNDSLSEFNESLVQSAVDHMENVIIPMQEFVYPEPIGLYPALPRFDFEYKLFEFDTVFLEDGKIRTEHQSAQYFVEELEQDVMLDMIYVPEGVFIMGKSKEDFYDVIPNEIQHQVHVSAFHMGKFEITQQQWIAVMHHNLSTNQGADFPVENVSWEDTIEFCKRLSIITGRHYRLPSEAEWEYSARAGTTTSFSFGAELTTQLANYYDSYSKNNSTIDSEPPSESCVAAYSENGVQYLQTKPVGSFFPNAFGLYDMHGNVFELCQDAWHEYYDNAPTDGSAWGNGSDANAVVIRGGSFDYPDDKCHSSDRGETGASYRYFGTGFRVACSLTPLSSTSLNPSIDD